MKFIKIVAFCMALFLVATIGYAKFDNPGVFDTFYQAIKQFYSDGTTLDLGSDDDWQLSYDEATNDSLIFQTTATNGSADDTALFQIRLNDGSGTLDDEQEVFEILDDTTELFAVDEDGDTTIAGSLTSAASSDPMIIIKDSDATAGDNNYVLDIDATDTGDGTEDIDVTEQVQRAGATITPRYIDGDQTYQIGTTGMPVRIMSQLLMDSYYWVDEFDEGNAADAVDEIGAHEAFWTVGGTNENDCANFANGVGGIAELKTVNTGDNDSTFIVGEPVIAVDSNPIVEFRFKVDNIVDAVAVVGLVEGSMTEITAAPDDDIFLCGLQEENGIDADHLVSLANDNNGGADYDDLGVAIVNNTYVIIRFDLTDTENPRVWVNETEIAAAMSGTVQAGTTLMPYAHVQVLVGGPVQRTMTIDYVKIWQDRG